MTKITIQRSIKAPLKAVFEVVSDPNGFANAVPHIFKVELLSGVQRGVGTRFRETRLMQGKEASTELEVTEFKENELIRMVADAGGTIWDSVFTVESSSEQTELQLVMTASAYKFIPKIVNFAMQGIVKKFVEKDLDSIKAYCEEQG